MVKRQYCLKVRIKYYVTLLILKMWCKPILKRATLNKMALTTLALATLGASKIIADILQKELGTNLGTEYIPNPYDGYQIHTQAEISTSKI